MALLRTAALLAAGALALAGCGTTTADMRYTAAVAAPVAAAHPIVAVGEIQDRRLIRSLYLGAIRDGLGNPLKTVQASMPVSDIVRDAVTGGLRARGLLAPAADARYELAVLIIKLDGDQYMQRQANAELFVKLLDRATGATAYSDIFKVELVEYSLAAGIIGSPDALRDLVQKAMQQVIDAALDSPGIRRSVTES